MCNIYRPTKAFAVLRLKYANSTSAYPYSGRKKSANIVIQRSQRATKNLHFFESGNADPSPPISCLGTLRDESLGNVFSTLCHVPYFIDCSNKPFA